MNILVTGGAGYIGSILVPELLDEGHKVTVYDNFIYKQTPFLHICDNNNLNVIRADILNYDYLCKQIPNKDIVIPLAAIVGAPACNNTPEYSKMVNHEYIMAINRIMKSNQKMRDRFYSAPI